MSLSPLHPLVGEIAAFAPKFASTLAATADKAGLVVTLPDGSTKPIPVTATPVVLADDDISKRATLSRVLTSATFKVAQAVLRGELRAELLSALSPLERELVLATEKKQRHLAVARVDYFVADRPYALELNATIPAMQAYSDIAAHTFIRAVGAAAGLGETQIEALVRQNGSNARALHTALVTCFQQERSTSALPQRIALLSRPNDAQLGEQRSLAKTFNDLGTPAEVVHPADLTYQDGKVTAHGKPVDLVYRHLFIRRLEALGAPEIRKLYAEAPTPHVSLLNGPASQYEVKGIFAELSRIAADPAKAQAAQLTDDEVSAVRQSVPWTRCFVPGPTTANDGSLIDDLVEHVARNPERYVLKRSWDYGGKQVFLGNTVGQAVFEERVTTTYGSHLDWRALCQRAASDRTGGGFVVQQVVLTSPEHHLLCTKDGIIPADLFVDYSAYASVGAAAQTPWGGVCRGSSSRIVNIVGGGGVIPLLHSSVADALLAALRQTRNFG